ncbi:MAG: hypothetical protein ACOX7H_05990 [Bacillota bacterium]|jgi:hypothetical protein
MKGLSCGNKGLICGNRNGLSCNVNNNRCHRPQGVKTLVQAVLDSCHQCTEVTIDVVIPVTHVNMPNKVSANLPPIGTCIPINPAGNITCQEISRDCQCINCKNMCLSTVLFNFPLQLHNPCNPCDAMFHNVTSIQNFTLKCAADSKLDCLNTRILSVKAIVTQVDCENITITINLVVDIVVRQTIFKEICVPGAFEPDKRECNDGINSPCDIIKKDHDKNCCPC